MEVKATRREGLEREYEFVVPGKEIREKQDEALEEIRSTIQLRGFRAGKAPMSIIKRRFADAALQDSINDRVKAEVESILKSNDEAPFGNPEVDISDPEGDEGNYRVKVAYECAPVIPDIDFGSLVVKRPVVSVDEGVLAEAVEANALVHAPFGEAEADRASRSGDKVVVSVVARVDGLEVPGTQADELEFVVRDDEDHERVKFIGVKYGFDPSLVSRQDVDHFNILGEALGMKAGDIAEFEFDVPDDPQFKHAAGRRASGEFTVLEVCPARRLEPEAFAEYLGISGLGVLKERLAERLGNIYQQYARQLMMYDMNSQIDRQMEFEVPRSIVDLELANLRNEKADRDEERESPPGSLEGEPSPGGPEAESGPAPDGAAETGAGAGSDAADEEEEKLRAVAARRLRRTLLYSDIQRKHELAVSDEEVRRFTFRTLGLSEGFLATERFRTDRAYADQFRYRATVEKVNDFMLQLVMIEDETCSSQDLAERWDRLRNIDVLERFGYADDASESDG